MDTEHRQGHWQRTYEVKTGQEVSWHQDSPEPSLRLVTAAATSLASSIIDIGGGTSYLVDRLVQRGFRKVSVLDVSSAALAKAQARLGAQASVVDWIAADITIWTPTRLYDVWHDRATFHFMVTEADRSAYLERLRAALARGGHAVIATFALDGPERCSGLPVMRYDPAGLADTLGTEFTLVSSERHLHHTPAGSVQPFQFSVFSRRLDAS
ncbi:MAG: class I SAM-dependent methyltransferase [Pseudorhodoplanes sp.]|jgi:SAM-dependent methyltransferase|nr:class I SAM-dependent methyltransferase [Pseudorhodoplanes sp.]